ncbi:hypothetical protein ATANTOWER_019099 [Ataeniobius toweri]|uniref:Uncharacterized protein n=1 Tax=Ataeniobius toweri TaxID=208326 RepID=A0ABU7C596_9TELE|nr:hypothetical protein [Ataeniobius toweri]
MKKKVSLEVSVAILVIKFSCAPGPVHYSMIFPRDPSSFVLGFLLLLCTDLTSHRMVQWKCIHTARELLQGLDKLCQDHGSLVRFRVRSSHRRDPLQKPDLGTVKSVPKVLV